MAASNVVVLVDQTSRSFGRRDLVPLWPDALWKIEQGVVRTLTWSEEGTLISLGYWGKGDVVGQPLTRLDPYQIECLTPVSADLIPPQQWSQELDAILSHTQQAQELHSIVQTQGTDQRLLSFLNWLAKKFGQSTDMGRLIDLRLTHLEISDVIGTTRVSVTRMMCRLEAQGIILRPGRHSIVLRSNRLA
ncbi:MAG: Crp/Fnr family transcriptional regulator [Microcoleaceae cyanobacterium]